MLRSLGRVDSGRHDLANVHNAESQPSASSIVPTGRESDSTGPRSRWRLCLIYANRSCAIVSCSRSIVMVDSETRLASLRTGDSCMRCAEREAAASYHPNLECDPTLVCKSATARANLRAKRYYRTAPITWIPPSLVKVRPLVFFKKACWVPETRMQVRPSTAKPSVRNGPRFVWRYSVQREF